LSSPCAVRADAERSLWCRYSSDEASLLRTKTTLGKLNLILVQVGTPSMLCRGVSDAGMLLFGPGFSYPVGPGVLVGSKGRSGVS
jgi:hypothetical protein